MRQKKCVGKRIRRWTGDLSQRRKQIEYFTFFLTNKEWQRIAREIRMLREARILEHLRQK